MIALNGILAPLVTPFQQSGDLDLEGFGRNVRAHLAAGCIGVVVTGSTGEAALLDDGERNALIERARTEVGGDRTLIVGTGSESTRATIARSRAAAERGADAVLVVAPHYYSDAMSPEALRQHYEQVADESPVPVLLYTIPKYMHFSLSPELVAELAQHDNIIGMKDSSGNLEKLKETVAAVKPGFQVLSGAGVSFWDALQSGASGAILAIANALPYGCVTIWEAFRTREHEAGKDWQARLFPASKLIATKHGIPGLKHAMDLNGYYGGPPRLPFVPPSPAARLEIEQAFDGLTS